MKVGEFEVLKAYIIGNGAAAIGTVMLGICFQLLIGQVSLDIKLLYQFLFLVVLLFFIGVILLWPYYFYLLRKIRKGFLLSSTACWDLLKRSSYLPYLFYGLFLVLFSALNYGNSILELTNLLLFLTMFIHYGIFLLVWRKTFSN